MAEEHGFQAPEGHRLCVNNCGFFGSPATKNMCSKCYGDLCLKKTGDSPLFSTPLSVAPPSSSVTAVQRIAPAVTSHEKEASTAAQPTAQPMNRCFACRKKVGLTGFKCRCGTTFCGTHRYPEKHGCTFDFKALGRETIARDNPVIKADKLQKI